MRDPIAVDLHLAKSARRFNLFQALRLIESAHANRPRLGKSQRPSDDPVRIGQQPGMAFAATEVVTYIPAADDGAARLDVNFGLLGTDGPMPLHLTEYVSERAHRKGDHTLKHFLDIFHHRLLTLLYRAWAAGEPVLNADRYNDDSFANCLASLSGFASIAQSGPDVSYTHAGLEFCGLLSDRQRHASGLQLLLAQSFGVPVKIEQFVGQWLLLPDAQRTRLGKRGATPLSKGLALGRKVWDRQHKIRVILGPLNAAQSRYLQPGSPGFRRLTDRIRLYIGGVLDWDVELRLMSEAVLPMQLNRGARLARDTWLGHSEASRHERSLRFCGAARI